MRTTRKLRIQKLKVQEMNDLLKYYDSKGYHTERVDISKLIWGVFSNDFVVGDKITWLGHDWVYGLMHGQEIIATEEEVKFIGKINFMKKIDELNFEPYKNLL